MVQLVVDTSELTHLTNSLKSQLTPKQFDKMMRYVQSDLKKNARTIIRKAVQEEYEAKTEWIYRGIQPAVISGGGGSVTCRIPLAGKRGNFGSTFPAKGGSPGWFTPKYTMQGKVLKGKWSTLAQYLPHQGGQPPFRNTKAKRLNGLVFTRTGAESKAAAMQARIEKKKTVSIERVSGLALPQMPLNRARGETEDRLLEYAEKRVIHHFDQIFKI